jgi:CBS domain-containing protein
MTADVHTCAPEDTLSAAARVMGKYDCRCLPVVDAERRVVGMITERDISVAAYTRGVYDAPVCSAMSKDIIGCSPDDPVG